MLKVAAFGLDASKKICYVRSLHTQSIHAVVTR